MRTLDIVQFSSIFPVFHDNSTELFVPRFAISLDGLGKRVYKCLVEPFFKAICLEIKK